MVGLLLTGLDNTLKMYDFNAAKEFVVGSHEAGIRCVDYCPEVNVVITGLYFLFSLV